MTNSYLVQYRYYAYDDGHHHWTDDYVSFPTESAAHDFIAELDTRIADGDTDVRPGQIVSEEDLYTPRTGY
jgi:hypothetical protein